MTTGNYPVWVSVDAMFAHSRLPRGVQDKYSKLIVKLKGGPAQHGLNYESVEGARDRHMRSVRVDNAYRAIVYDRGGVMVVLWVDEHDKAYRWAKNRVVGINPQSAAVQIVDMSLVAPEGTSLFVPAPTPKAQPPRFAKTSDADLIRLGVPDGVLSVVRAMVSDEDIDAARGSLPNDALDALTGLAAGISVDEILRELERLVPPKIDVEDFAAALQTDESRRSFWLAENDEELEKMLDAPLEYWRIFLHPTQRRLVERAWNGPVLVRGGAGTGKTVVAMHRARYLAEQLVRARDESGRILFTTFTRNLAADIHANLKKLCSPAAMKRIEVMNLDSWVSDFLRTQGFPRKIVFADSGDLNEAWDAAYRPRSEAVDFDLDFVKDEWKQVVQARGIDSLPDYLRAQRTGRGTAIDRATKTKLWEIFAAYRAQLDDKGLAEPDDAYREAAEILKLRPILQPYRAIIVDEAQDMGQEAFRLLAALAPATDGEPGPDSLFIVGDAHQRIYGRQASMAKSGIKVRGRSRNLRINYRTTDEIRRWAVALLEGVTVDDLDEGADDLKGYRSLYHGPIPEFSLCGNSTEQTTALLAWIDRCRGIGLDDTEIVILGRIHRVVAAIKEELRYHNIETVLLEAHKADDGIQPGIRLATMHRAKGLEFGAVAIVDLNDGLIPPRMLLDKAADKVMREAVVNAERSLLHVAATRAKKRLFLSCSRTPSILLPSKRR